MKDDGLTNFKRRDFIQFFTGALVFGLFPIVSLGKEEGRTFKLNFAPLKPSSEDKLLLVDGLEYEIMLSYGDKINKEGDTFGFNNDYNAFIPTGRNEGWFWTNHEYAIPSLVSGYEKGMKRTKDHIDKEMYSVGGSLYKIKKQNSGRWKFIPNSGTRLHAKSVIPFANRVKIEGKDSAIGTLANCAGGVTPWGTFLTCEENTDNCYGDRNRFKKEIKKSSDNWDKYYPYPPEHYGWVVEIDPFSKKAKKHTSIGRYAHECCTVTKAKNGKIVAYSADDKENEHLYKFISNSNDSLDEGELFVANIERGEWISLNRNKHKVLQENFKTQLEIQTYTREAAKMVGASKLDRPEDIEISPVTGDVFVTLTKNKKTKNYFGHIMKISEEKGDHGAKKFHSNTLVAGGEKTGFACPDNLVFDKNGNLWMASDISDDKVGHGRYAPFKNNGIYFIPLSGKSAGSVYQVASAPNQAEFTGLFFSKDYKTLFASVQHPGGAPNKASEAGSDWPEGNGKAPRSSVVQIYGPSLEKLIY